LEDVRPRLQALAREITIDPANTRLTELGDLSKSPAAMRGEVLSASMRIANRRVRLSSGMFGSPLFVPERGHQYPSAVSISLNGEPIWTGN
jgi:hypothetical protein